MGYWKIGQRITSARINRTIPVGAYKTATHTRTNTTTPTPDPELVLPLLPLTNYSIMGCLLTGSNGDARGDFQIRWAWTGVMSVAMGGLGPHDSIATGTQSDVQSDYWQFDNVSPTNELSYGTSNNGTATSPLAFVVVGPIGGQLTLEWAQSSLNVNSSFLLSGSWIMATPVMYQ